MHILAFLYLLLSYLSIKTNELLFILDPMNIPFSSYIEELIKGYVANNPLVNTFLLATLFISLLL